MNNKKYLAKIIAKDPRGLQIISACCSEGKVKIEEIKFLKKNKLFLLSVVIPSGLPSEIGIFMNSFLFEIEPSLFKFAT